MACTTMRTPNGGVAILCRRGQKPPPACHICGFAADKLCDFREKPKAKRCDQPLCDACAISVGEDLDHCPDHPSQLPLL